MEDAPEERWLMVQQDQRITEAIDREYAWLRNFRRRAADQFNAEDIL